MTGSTLPTPRGSDERYFHGGPPGLRGEILPPKMTGVPSTAQYGAEAVCRLDRVYLTTLPDAAVLFAAGAPSAQPGWVYEVTPFGEVEPDPDYNGDPGESVCARRARIKRVYKRLTGAERRAIFRILRAA
jgi:hypothetical protein